MRKFTVRVNGKSYQVEVEEGPAGAPAARFRGPAPEMPDLASSPPPAGASPGGGKLTSPMPGTIIEVKVKEGETVEQGQVLLILEAMKMENEIPSPAGGRIASIAVEDGSVVSSGDLLLVIE